MATLGFIGCAIFLLYLLGACVVGFFAVSFGIGMGGGKRIEYLFPLVGLCLDVYLWTLLLPHCPFTISML